MSAIKHLVEEESAEDFLMQNPTLIQRIEGLIAPYGFTETGLDKGATLRWWSRQAKLKSGRELQLVIRCGLQDWNATQLDLLVKEAQPDGSLRIVYFEHKLSLDSLVMSVRDVLRKLGLPEKP